MDSKCKCKRRRTMKLPGAKWEKPIPNSKEYWKEFCDNEEKRLIVVRNPFFHISPLSKNDSVLPDLNTRINNSFNLSLFNSDTDKFENSSHRSDGKLFPKPALKTPSRTKISDTTQPKVVRIPKLGTRGPQPSSVRIFAGEVDGDEPRADFAALPVLHKFRTTPASNKLRRHLRLPEKTNSSEKRAPGSRENKTAKPESEPEHTKSRGEDQKLPTDQVTLKYSGRFAYKALKRLTSNKKLDFEPKITEQLLSEASRESSDEERGPLKREERKQDSEKSLCFGDARRKSIKDSEFDVDGASLKSEEATSKTILSESRCTSGPSLEFVYPESVESRSGRVLASIPRLSGFPRKNRDRCLPCMFKPFEAPLERKISLPRTALRRIINSRSARIASSGDSSDDSDSTFLGGSKNKAEGTNREVDVTFDEPRNAVQRQVTTEELVQEKRQEEKKESTADSGISSQVKEDVAPKNLNDVQTKAPASFHDESSEEDDSIVISISDEQAKPKYFVPCHAPTVFRPSLEPLRALRHRKPTTLQDRIAMLESSWLKKSISADDQDDVQEKAKSVAKMDEGKVVPPLTKAKSVSEKLTLEKDAPSRKSRTIF
nr:PREDICTED: uncharacterized protein LOC105662201 [Megachile rotundata]